MSLRVTLQGLATAIADQAERDPAFAAVLKKLLAGEEGTRSDPPPRLPARRRRTAAILDPVALAREGENVLRDRLAPLDLAALRDIVADHGMDPSRKIAKWRTKSKVAEEIVALSMQRARKGDGFRKD